MTSKRQTLNRSFWASGVLLAGVITLAACSSPSHPAAASNASPSSTMSNMPPMTPSGGAAGGGTTAVATNTVMIKGFAFGPAAITVKVGTKVTWTNQDTDAHTVTSQNNSGPLSSTALNTGQSYSYTFTKPGTYAYFCTIHPFMTATVTVTS